MEALETDEEVVLALIGEALEGSEEVTVEEASATVVEAAVEEEVQAVREVPSIAGCIDHPNGNGDDNT